MKTKKTMLDCDGVQVSVGDDVHFFGMKNMRPTGKVIDIDFSNPKQPIALIVHVNGGSPWRRYGVDIRRIRPYDGASRKASPLPSIQCHRRPHYRP